MRARCCRDPDGTRYSKARRNKAYLLNFVGGIDISEKA